MPEQDIHPVKMLGMCAVGGVCLVLGMAYDLVWRKKAKELVDIPFHKRLFRSVFMQKTSLDDKFRDN